MSSSKRVVGTGGRDLTLVGVGPRDVGLYACVAVNPAGEAQLTISLYVICEDLIAVCYCICIVISH